MLTASQLSTTRRGLLAGGAAAAALPATLAATAAGAAKAAELDGELLAACERFIFLDSEYGRLCWTTDEHDPRYQQADQTALEAEFEAVSDEIDDLGEWLTQTTPRTPEGIQAKARVVLVYLRDDPPQDMIDGLQLSIMRDLAGRV